MIYPIVVYGSTVLRQMCEDIGQDYEQISEVIDNMWETMYYSEGIGLAAPQINLPIRLFVIDGNDLSDDFPELKDFKQTFINAKIIERSETTNRDFEGCLSIPG
ncbi:MAG TPA: peptide deformylase, partial [Marinilabiliaceae bacterium]|nr:peptide deformylase [Marinilabiliaceae bacterium]